MIRYASALVPAAQPVPTQPIALVPFTSPAPVPAEAATIAIQRNGSDLAPPAPRISAKRSRAEYELNSLSRRKPRLAEGISRRTWYRRNAGPA